MAEAGTVIITHDDGTVIKRPLASVVIMDTDRGQPRELLAMGEVYRILSQLDFAEARRVVTWLCQMYPEPVAVEKVQ